MLKDLPTSTFEYKQNLAKLKKQFSSLKISFSKTPKNKIKINKINKKNKETKTKTKTPNSLVLLSMGKDSLLTLAVAREIGLKPSALYINDTVSPTENKFKISTLKAISKEFRIKGHIITNSIEKINDFETWNRKEMSLNYAHMVTSFCLISLPLVNFYNINNIILGNEKNFDFFIKKQSNKLYPSYDQTTEWTIEQEKIIQRFEKVHLFSIIRPITDAAITKILHARYPEIAKYQISCYGLDASRRKRWCLDCSCCSSTSLFLSAFGINPKKIGLEKIFSKKHRKLYVLFNPKYPTIYDLLFSREQELLMLLFSMRNGQRGYIIDKFKKKFLKEALDREDELRKKYFKIYPSRIPQKLKPKILSIYREELKDLV